MSALQVSGVTVGFGGRIALDGVAVHADRGQITGLIGPNGAGKTTLFNVICGLQPATGSVMLDGVDVSRLAPYKRARRGLARTFQRLELFGLLTVRENIRLGAEMRRDNDAHATTDAVLDRLGLSATADMRADRLPTGQARLVELGRALATAPLVLLLDEPASGQDDAETESFAVVLRDIAADGVAVVLVEHDVPLVMDTCDLIHVLDLGHVIASGSPAEVQHDEKVLAAYLGTTAGPT